MKKTIKFTQKRLPISLADYTANCYRKEILDLSH